MLRPISCSCRDARTFLLAMASRSDWNPINLSATNCVRICWGVMGPIKVTLVQNDGVVRTLEHLEPGKSLMVVARDAGVVGILGDCGGACACATCHVYVEPDWLEVVGLPDEVEAGMLDGVSGTLRSNSRLSCQIQLRPELDGLKVTVAPLP